MTGSHRPPDPGAIRALRVTADDLGLSEAVDDGIFEAYDRGVVTHASVLAGGPAFDHAVRGLRARPGLRAGLHLAFTDLPPLTDGVRRARFIRDGRFASSLHVAAAIATGELSAAAIEAEVDAQAARLADAGVAIEHVDGHQHVHVLPGIAPAAIRACRRLGIGRVRVPIESAAPPAPPLGPIVATARAATLTLASAPLGVQVLWSGLKTTGAFHGAWCAGQGSVARFAHVLARLRPGENELMTHPGRPPAPGDAPPYRLAWEEELAALCSPEIAALVRAPGVALDRA
jgi:predicted glycoside hydrolase/deacetylase ChbG (UPF0249 family)